MKKTEKLFNELVGLIPQIQEEPEKWKAFVKEMVEKRPGQKIDANFKKRLKQEILSVMKEKNAIVTKSSQKTSSPAFAPWSWLFGGAAGFALIFIFTFTWWNNQRNLVIPEENVTESAYMESDEAVLLNENGIQISQLGDEKAFGELDLSLAESDTTFSANESQPAPMVRMEGGGGDAVTSGFSIYNGERINYNYEYLGESLEKLPDTTLVYAKKLQTDQILNETLRPFLDQMDMGMIDLNKFSPLEFRQISLAEIEGEIPYQVSLDLYWGNMSVNPDYEAWQKKYCPSGFCEYQPLTKADIPSDTQLIGWAREFVNRFGISVENMGEPVVQKYWETYPAADRIEEPEFYPETLSVVFPYLIDGNLLRDSSDYFVGVSVEVNLREEVAISANAPVLNLESSPYPARSSEGILDFAAVGGQYGVQYNNPDRIINLKLDTPTKELRRIWQYRDGKSQELMMEMLVFPVIKESEPTSDSPDSEDQTKMILPPSYYTPQEVLVPLAETKL